MFMNIQKKAVRTYMDAGNEYSFSQDPKQKALFTKNLATKFQKARQACRKAAAKPVVSAVSGSVSVSVSLDPAIQKFIDAMMNAMKKKQLLLKIAMRKVVLGSMQLFRGTVVALGADPDAPATEFYDGAAIKVDEADFKALIADVKNVFETV